MPAKFLQLLSLLCWIFVLVNAGVKIEITRLKDTSKPQTTISSVVAAIENTTLATEKSSASDVSTPTTMSTETTTSTTTTSTFSPNAVTTTSKANETVNNSTAITEASTVSPTNSTTVNKINTTAIQNHTLAITNSTKAPASSLLTEFTRRQMRRKLIPPDYYCPCDLKINFCDINCCCDVDCASREIMQTLKCNEREWSIHDYEDTSDLPLCSQTRRFSLFCVVDNSRRRKMYRKRDYKIHEVNILSVVQYKWPSVYDQSVIGPSSYREHYTFGDAILAWDESSEEMQFVAVPWSFVSSNCDVKAPVKHLINDKTKCVQTIDDHDQFINDIQSKLKSIKILKQRKPLDSPALVMSDFCKSPQNGNETEKCIYAEVYHCVDRISLRTCKSDANSTLTSSENSENFITNELSIQFHHNFTNILNCTVFFVYHELGDEVSSTFLTQTISVEYLESNETYDTRDAHLVSGNIGYMQHKPVIVTKFLLINETQNEENIRFERVLAYFHNETNCTSDDHYMKLPVVQTNGDCVLDNTTFNRIDFGESSRIKCNAVLTANAFNETNNSPQMFHLLGHSHNYTQTCRAFQRTIFNYLLHRFDLENPNATVYSEFNMRLSELGNPRNNTNYWIDFKTTNAPIVDDIVAGNVAGGSDTEPEFLCTNMVLSVRYEFFYGVMMVGAVPNQALIKVAQIQFGNRVNLKFKLDDDILKVPLSIDVMFYDFSRVVRNSASALVASNLCSLAVVMIIAKPIFAPF